MFRSVVYISIIQLLPLLRCLMLLALLAVFVQSRSVGQVFLSAESCLPVSEHQHSHSQSATASHAEPQYERFTAVARHPTAHSLYALASAVSNSVLLWDIRQPSQVIEELALPLIRQVTHVL